MELLYICLFVVVLLVGIIIGLLVESIKHGDLIESLNEAVNTIRGEAHTPRENFHWLELQQEHFQKAAKLAKELIDDLNKEECKDGTTTESDTTSS